MNTERPMDAIQMKTSTLCRWNRTTSTHKNVSAICVFVWNGPAWLQIHLLIWHMRWISKIWYLFIIHLINLLHNTQISCNFIINSIRCAPWTRFWLLYALFWQMSGQCSECNGVWVHCHWECCWCFGQYFTWIAFHVKAFVMADICTIYLVSRLNTVYGVKKTRKMVKDEHDH